MTETEENPINVELTHLAILQPCMDPGGYYFDDVDWPCNIISRMTNVYPNGQISRGTDVSMSTVDAAELRLCKRLAEEAELLMAGIEVGMGSQTSTFFKGFFIPGAAGEPAETAIDAELIRRRFGGTIFPPATITAEPLAERGIWWEEVEQDLSESEPDCFIPWRRLIEWFVSRPEFVDSAFVRIGDWYELNNMPTGDWPPGAENNSDLYPRLALGLTRRGSLTGLFGFAVLR